MGGLNWLKFLQRISASILSFGIVCQVVTFWSDNFLNKTKQNEERRRRERNRNMNYAQWRKIAHFKPKKQHIVSLI